MNQLYDTVLWRHNEDGYACHYVYGLVLTGSGALLAFAEGRFGRYDHDPHDLVVKRSEDAGRTWSSSRRIIASGPRGDCFVNPTPVLERRTGRLFVVFGHASAQATTRLLLAHSDDDGRTWSGPRDLTSVAAGGAGARTFHLPGPGHGIQLEDGRLLVPVWHRHPLSLPLAEREYLITILGSDDAGEHWHHLATLPSDDAPNESRVVELQDGTLLLNARSGAFSGNARRLQARSTDGGRSWSPLTYSTLPPAYATDAGFATLAQNGREAVCYSAPADPDTRRRLTVWTSHDAGATWPHADVVWPDVAHYSDLVGLPDGTLGVVYGRGALDPSDERLEGNVAEVAFCRLQPVS